MLPVARHKQSGAAIVTIPPSVLKSLDLKISAVLPMDVRDGALVMVLVSTSKSKRYTLALMMVAATPSKRKRYTLAQLLDGATPKSVKALNDDTAWPREGNLVGQELA